MVGSIPYLRARLWEANISLRKTIGLGMVMGAIFTFKD